jgi:hypothetical protein
LERYQAENNVVFLPKDELLIAHLIAHGLAQHGFEPKTYPLLRMVSDLFDLGVAETDRFESDVFPLVSTDVSRDEVLALIELVTSLRKKDVTTCWTDEHNTALLLRHFVLAAINEQYQARVLLRRVVQTYREIGVTSTARELIQYTFFLPNDHLAKLYGKTTPYWILRLSRPLNFAWRSIKRLYKSTRKLRN